MTLHHAVAWIDHQNAQVLQFDAEHVEAANVHSSTRHGREHGSDVRTDHEYFGQVCDALAGIPEVLVVGPHTAQADFRHYALKHRAETAGRIVGYETGDHPTENQLVALGRKYFLKVERMGLAPD
jgi:stalled ribosome rescue protein Dom34